MTADDVAEAVSVVRSVAVNVSGDYRDSSAVRGCKLPSTVTCHGHASIVIKPATLGLLEERYMIDHLSTPPHRIIPSLLHPSSIQ
jgi:hypothetical protein